MKLSNLIREFWERHQPNDAAIPGSAQPAGDAGSAMQKMLEMVSQTQEVELSCDEVHRLLDEFAEMVARGEDAAQAMPLVRHHVDTCPECREEFEALMRILGHGS